ncbi:MAG: riboflavin synthase subunit alpha [Verrucomicrobia bacterium GWF2_62_7]|nr:MAG: riboflavin synthase subunit alpha [Verrucomicrobia bacterium GWF2_62_7]
MFTGLVEEAGEVVSVKRGRKSTELTVRAATVYHGLRKGDSLAVNGACLTTVRKRGALLGYDVLEETLRVTNLQYVHPGDVVNLERPMRADARLGGHFVLGHVDGVGKVRRWEQVGKDWVLEVTVPKKLMRYLIYKGSVAVDGISLTVADLGPDWIRVWIIPHTRDVTNLCQARVGGHVNLEADVLGKYVEQLLAKRKEA